MPRAADNTSFVKMKAQPTSFRLELRYSAKGMADIIMKLSDAQKSAVRDILVLVLSFLCRSILSHLGNTDEMVIRTGHATETRIRAEDVHRILRLPFGERPVTGVNFWDNSRAVSKLRSLLGFSGKENALSIVRYLDIISNTLNCETDSEKSRFICAFISLMALRMLAPRNKQDPVQNDFYSSITNPFEVAQYNWCQYVVDEIKSASMKVRKTLFNGGKTVNLFGCLIFLQILFLEKQPPPIGMDPKIGTNRVHFYSCECVTSVMQSHADHESFKGFKEFCDLLNHGAQTDSCETGRRRGK